ncbi:paf1 domain-containing protein [Ditylenchus destructor]|uniref:RNA polymerase II-associated factor 1 homolog n=1 Tax=Ditylenchus destructor TaxID=166010 RepID=A0AAD4NGQ5_9BILA|nr:paf1 domain-containing protein [Ditylenchus destructor]
MTSNNHSGVISPSSGTKERLGVDRVDFICKPKYSNTLPDLPFEPKFLQCPFVSQNRFVGYRPTTLEKSYKYELLTEPDLNVKIDLIDPMTYAFNPHDRMQINLKDEKLLEDESASQQNTKRSQQHSRIVPWMRKTEYISTEFNRFGVGAERQESKIGYSTKKKFANEQTYKDRQSQINAINKTFTDVKIPAKKHSKKPGVYAVEEWPVLPDSEMWAYPFAQVIFDSDPLPYYRLNQAERDGKLAHAIIRGMMDSEGQNFVGYFSPTTSALEQMQQDQAEHQGYKEGFTYEHQMEREYNWTVKNKATKGYEQENYFFVMRDGAVYYNELESRVRLVRRPKGQTTLTKKSILNIRYRQPNAREEKMMNNRIRQLLYPYETREDEAEEDEEEDDKDENEDEDMDDSQEKIQDQKMAKVIDSDSASTSGKEDEEEQSIVKKKKKPLEESSSSGSEDESESEGGSTSSEEDGGSQPQTTKGRDESDIYSCNARC